MFFLKIMSKFFKAMGSAASPRQIAWGFALGAILGLTPLWSLHNLIVISLILVLSVNVSAALMAFLLFSFFAWALNPIFHTVGFFFLTKTTFFESFWTALYNSSFMPFTRFNNTVVTGSLVCSLLLVAPNYFLFKWLVKRYRESWIQVVQKWRIIQVLKGNRVIRFYLKVKKVGG
ncbi:MAG: TIGR03546 family protein [bacterium]